VADYVEKCYQSDKWEGKSREKIEQYRENYLKMADKLLIRSLPINPTIGQLLQLAGLKFRSCSERVRLNTSTLLSDHVKAKDSDSVELVLKQTQALSDAWTS
jgi:hypothetical protein